MVSTFKTNYLIHSVLMKKQLPVTISFSCLVWLDSAYAWEDAPTAHKLPAAVFTLTAVVSWEIHFIYQFWLRGGRQSLDHWGHNKWMCLCVTSIYSFSMLLGCITLIHDLWDEILWDNFKSMLLAGSVEKVKWDVVFSGWSLEFIIHSKVQKVVVYRLYGE